MISYRVEKIEAVTFKDFSLFCEHLPELLERINSLVFYEDKLRCAYAYYVAKEMAAKKLNCSIDELTIKFGNGPKPFFEHNPVFFNISHSHNYIACAVDNNPIGIDIEKMAPFDMDDLSYAFSNSEIEYILEQKNSVNREIRACEVWTFKEAYQKLLGVEWYDFKSVSMLKMNDMFNRFYIDNYILTVCSSYL